MLLLGVCWQRARETTRGEIRQSSAEAEQRGLSCIWDTKLGLHLDLLCSVLSASLSRHELLILHTAEALEWATYLQHILKSSKNLGKTSILLYAVSAADQLHGYNFNFQHVKCTVLLLTAGFLDLLNGQELRAAVQKLLYPSHRVVALLCGVSEADVSTGIFKDWSHWRKLYAEDEPAVYISTILESISNSEHMEEGCRIASADWNATAQETEEVMPKEPRQIIQEIKDSVATQDSPAQLTCLTVQPQRIMCGEQETIYIILKHKLEDNLIPIVEFSSGSISPERVSATLENDFTLSVPAPDFPAGVVSLTLHTGQSSISLSSLTYHTYMEEVGRCLEKAVDPVDFIRQAFSLTTAESVDEILTDSLKTKMPAAGLQVFGNGQIEELNMTAYQRTEELPTLLHFAAKYGLRKLTTFLLHCPGALQAYSVMNKHGDYPNTLAEKSGFCDLRQVMDEFVIHQETDKLSFHASDPVSADDSEEVYERMNRSWDDVKDPDGPEDIYVSMLMLDSECAEDLYEVMNSVTENPEEAILRKFFQGRSQKENAFLNKTELEEDVGELNFTEEEDPYIIKEDIYDMVETDMDPVMFRPPAPIPRPEIRPEPQKICHYVSRAKNLPPSQITETRRPSVQPAMVTPSPIYDYYAGMKTPGQRQLISLQEQVKVGEITVDEAVEEFKNWKIDHERRNVSIRYQQENLKSLRESINRRHKRRVVDGKDVDLEISAPLPANFNQTVNAAFDYGVYESAPREVVAAAPTSPSVPHATWRGHWKTGSTSSTSSSGSNRLSTISYSSGAEPDFEEISEIVPPRPPRPSGASAVEPPPRIPPRIPERVPEMSPNDRYISCPTRAVPQRPTQGNTAPPIPRRYR
ncbi:phosphoinositide 3-kinase adapter protein 1 isoform X1 [Synchiropus splendidus]|uniref:phosphoinositide 3-kinase adapter protein 1 isoform X1 n=1 Tax=Synchiropus splendidus TaxID=270530 RepID=UPI00237DB25A|nr:phosphoinositide 3-kinase adapter protein 1 isoform X1 [Synchiropus splendidus]